jgi:hypothetical protein
VAQFKVLSLHLSQGTPQNLQSEQPISGPRSETETFQIRTRSVNHWTMTLGVVETCRVSFQLRTEFTDSRSVRVCSACFCCVRVYTSKRLLATLEVIIVNVAEVQLAPLFRIREVPCSNVGHETDYPK